MEREQIAAILIEANERGRIAAAESDQQMIQVEDQDGMVYDPFSYRFRRATLPICGFASVRVKGLRGKVLAEFRHRGFEKHYFVGQYLWVGDYNQSYDLKSAYTKAYAKTLTEHGFNAWSESWPKRARRTDLLKDQWKIGIKK
jgi:hypothetical protein